MSKQVLEEINKNNSLVDSFEHSAKSRDKKDKDFDFKIISIKRVTKMYKGGRRMKISVFVAVGDKKGRIGLGIGKSDDVKTAQDKAIQRAKKRMFKVSLKGTTLPHSVEKKFGSAKIVIKPAAPGTGIIAGSSVRMIMELVGVKDVLSKILGTRNSIANAYCVVEALKSLRSEKL
jgi:small subunit ribosomal protein S5